MYVRVVSSNMYSDCNNVCYGKCQPLGMGLKVLEDNMQFKLFITLNIQNEEETD